jgi:hypothetical protein
MLGLDLKDLNTFKGSLKKIGFLMPEVLQNKVFDLGVKVGSMNTEIK